MELRNSVVALVLASAACGAEHPLEQPTTEPSATNPEDPVPDPSINDGSVLAIGDSILTWNEESAGSIPDVYGASTDQAVTNRAVGGARLLAGERSIPSQYAESSRDYARVLLDGGGNDVGGDGCGCGNCLSVVDEIIGADSRTGRMVDLVNQIVGDGAEAILLGYYPPPPFGEFESCREEFVVMNERFAAFAASDSMIRFVNMGDVVDYTTHPEYFDDAIHPSVAGSKVIGEYIAEQLVATPSSSTER